MSTENEKWRWTYQPNGVSTTFAFDNLVLAASDLVVSGWTETGQPLALPGYTVTGVGNQTGGNVVFATAPAAQTGAVIEIWRRSAALQGKNFKDFVQEDAKTREQMADRAMLGLQELKGRLLRTLSTSPLDADAPLVMPPRSQLANKFLYMRPDGTITGVEGPPPSVGASIGVETFDDLRGFSGTAAVVHVAGKTRPSDGGGGPFTLDPTDGTTLDDGGQTIVDVTGRRWKRINSFAINVRSFGARGDGKAINSLSVTIANGSDVLVVAGALFSNLTLDVGKRIVINGAGPGGGLLSTTIKQVNNLNSIVLNATASAALSGVAATVLYGTDDTAAIMATATYVAARPSGGRVYLPEGRYLLSDQIAPPTNSFVEFVGDGCASTIVVQTNLTKHGFKFVRNNYWAGGGVVDMAVESGLGRQAGNYFGAGSTGTAIYVDGSSDNFRLTNLTIANFANGIALYGCWNGRYRSIQILFFADTGLLIDKSPTIGLAGGSVVDGWKISNYGYAGTVVGTKGVRIRATGGEFFNVVDVQGVGTGWLIDPRAGDHVAYLGGSLAIGDSSSGDGWMFDATLGKISTARFDNLWSGFNEGCGIIVTGANASNIFVSGRVRENKLHGILLQGPGFTWEDGTINNNSRQSTNVYSGVRVAAGVSDWAILNSFIGNDASSAWSDQRNGIEIDAGASDRFKVMGNTFRGNLNGAMVNGATGTDFIVGPNVPLTTTSVNRTNGVFPGVLQAGRNASIVHTFLQGNDTALSVYSDTPNQVSLDASLASSPGTKIDIFANPYGGAFKVGGFVGMSAAYFPGVGTTASAANVFMNSGSSPANQLLRSTSSKAYKDQIEDLDDALCDDFMEKVKAKWFRSKSPYDNPEWSYIGFVSEDVARHQKRLVNYGYQEKHFERIEIPEHEIEVEKGNGRTAKIKVPGRVEYELKKGAKKVADGVQYDRVVVIHHNVLQRLLKRVARLESQRKSSKQGADRPVARRAAARPKAKKTGGRPA